MATVCPKITFFVEYPPRGIAGGVEIAALDGWGRLWKHKMLDNFGPPHASPSGSGLPHTSGSEKEGKREKPAGILAHFRE